MKDSIIVGALLGIMAGLGVVFAIAHGAPSFSDLVGPTPRHDASGSGTPQEPSRQAVSSNAGDVGAQPLRPGSVRSGERRQS